MRGLKLGSFTEKSYQKKSVVIFWSLKNVMKLHVDPWPLIDIVQTVIEPFDLTSYPVTFSRFFFASWQIYIVLFQIRMNLSFKKHIFQRFFFFFQNPCVVFLCFSALSVTGDAYFSLLSAIGQKAYHTTSSRSLGWWTHILVLSHELTCVFCGHSFTNLLFNSHNA